MHRAGVLLLLVSSACGRVGFDALGDGQTDGGEVGQSLQLPAGGQMAHAIVAPNGDWYAISQTAGAFRSTNQGMAWTRCGARVGTALAVTSDGAVWMSGTVVGRSTDQCATWSEPGAVEPSAFVFAEGANVWALTNAGLRKWSGSQWATVTTPITGFFSWMGHSGAHYFIGTFGLGLLESPDALTWTQYNSPTAFDSLAVAEVAGGASHSYAVTTGGSNNIACSDGAATTWTNCSGFGGLAITVDPINDAHAVVAVYDDLGETMNAFGGLARSLRELSMDAAVVEDIDYLPSGELLAATDRGIFVAPQGSILFQPRLAGLDAWDIDHIQKDGDDIWLSTRGGPLHSSRGLPFEVRTMGVTGNTVVRHIRVMPAPDTRVIAGGRNLYVSDNRGDTWTMLQPMTSAEGFYAADIAFNGDRMFIATGARLLVSDPPYSTSTAVAFPGGPYPGNILLVSAGRVWIGTDRGLRFSDNGGSIFTASDLGTRVVRDLLELPDGRLLVATQDGAWISNTAKSMFMRAGLDGKYVDGLTLANAAGDKVIAATAQGVFYGQNMVWTPVPGAESTPSSATLIDDTTGQLIVGTDGQGLIRVQMP